MNDKLYTIPPLETVLGYKNEKVIKRFQSMYDLDNGLIHEIFEQVQIFLWISNKMKYEKNKVFTQLKAQVLLDEMWHNFILFTKDYTEYCNKYYGRFCHHDPCIETDQAEQSQYVCSEELKDIMYYINDQLGTDIVYKWYIEWSETYTIQYLHQRKKINFEI